MQRIEGWLRPANVLAAAVLGLTLVCAQRAHAVVVVPNAAHISYNLAPGTELAITVPAFNSPVHVMATCDTPGVRGVADLAVLRTAVAPLFLEWTGQNSPGAGGGTVTSGFSAVNEVLMAEVSFDGTVELEVASAAAMAISNESAAARTGRVLLIW